MGKGRIVSHLGDGLYNVELLHDRDRIERELEFLAIRLSELNAELTTLETERESLEADQDAISAQIDATIAAAEEGELPDVEALLAELAQASANIRAQDVRIGLVKGRILEATKRQQQLQSVPNDPVQQAWCADYTEDLTGEVATVEVPAEGVVGEFATWRRAQIRPGYSGRATYSAARDGQMHHRLGQISYQAFYNAAILPGVQRHKPQYRIGTVTAIDRDTDTCSLTIQGEDSSAQSLTIDPPDLEYSRTGVPIEYMECNSTPFEVGDRVLVEFQGRDWDQPKVIGFEADPRPCSMLAIYEIRYRAVTAFGVSFPVECYPAWPGGDYWTGFLRLQRLSLNKQTVLVAKTSDALQSVQDAISLGDVDLGLLETKTLSLAFGGVTEIIDDATMAAKLPTTAITQFAYTDSCNEVGDPIMSTGVKWMVPDTSVLDAYPTWPISFDAVIDNISDPPKIDFDLLYRLSTERGMYVGTEGDARTIYSEAMEDSQAVALGTIAELTDFPPIDGMTAKEIVKALPGVSRTEPLTSGPGVNVFDAISIVVRYGTA